MTNITKNRYLACLFDWRTLTCFILTSLLVVLTTYHYSPLIHSSAVEFSVEKISSDPCFAEEIRPLLQNYAEPKPTSVSLRLLANSRYFWEINPGRVEFAQNKIIIRWTTNVTKGQYIHDNLVSEATEITSRLSQKFSYCMKTVSDRVLLLKRELLHKSQVEMELKKYTPNMNNSASPDDILVLVALLEKQYSLSDEIRKIERLHSNETSILGAYKDLLLGNENKGDFVTSVPYSAKPRRGFIMIMIFGVIISFMLVIAIFCHIRNS